MDKRILQLIKKNPEKGMTALIKQYSGLVFTIVKNKISGICSNEDIEETVSDVFISFYKTIDSVDLDKGRLSAYLATIAKRKAIDKLRSHGSRKEISIDDAFSYIELEDSFNLETEIEKKLLLKRLIDEVNALGEPDSTIIYRKYFLGESSKAIAEYLKLTDENVRVRLHRALRKLETSMKGENYED